MRYTETEKPDNIPELFIKQWLLELIKSGQKTIDIRQEGAETANLQIGGKIKYTSSSESITATITDIRKRTSIQNILETEPLAQILPGKSTKESKQLAAGMFNNNAPLLAIEIKYL